MTSSLVGSEMCIRDSHHIADRARRTSQNAPQDQVVNRTPTSNCATSDPVSYTHLTLPTICSV
eukprot:8704123-Prorocentrum_lima.AAC.1